MTQQIATIADVLPSETTPTTDLSTVPAVDPTVPAEDPTPSVEELIANLDRRAAEIAHAEEVLTFQRRRPPVSRLTSTRTSTRVMCGGCSFGIRKETTPVVVNGEPMHPNCAKVRIGTIDPLKVSPKYVAAAVPLMTVRIADSRKVPAPGEPEFIGPVLPAVDSAPAQAPEASLEDSTTDLVQEAVSKSTKKSRRSA